ncbi:MAG TPA: 3-deoxy-8-phosphooctulonate synthase [Longimicrobiales bacterium]|jgi:2-dehydro-3-deoxyphosphooctonate aldolase (KDO 8-P synthase)
MSDAGASLLERFTLIAGPCVLEDDALNLAVARRLADLSDELGLPIVFKASFDKANRSKLSSPRGPGLERGLEALRRVAGETGLPLLTDIHEPAQAEAVAQVVDILQIPAFLCRQTDLVVAAAATGRVLNLKKGQWMAPEEMAGAVDKARGAGATRIAVTERGTVHGYGDLVVDMRSFRRVRETCRVPVVFDGTHSVQRPGLADGSSGGDPEHTPDLVRAAVAAGCDGLFLETHPEPGKAPSDGHNMMPLERLPELLDDVLAIREALAREAGAPATAQRLEVRGRSPDATSVSGR